MRYKNKIKNNLLLSERNVKADNAAGQSDNQSVHSVFSIFPHDNLLYSIAVSVLILYPQNHKNKNVSLIAQNCNVMKNLKIKTTGKKHKKLHKSEEKADEVEFDWI